jgi:hypothetical protein
MSNLEQDNKEACQDPHIHSILPPPPPLDCSPPMVLQSRMNKLENYILKDKEIENLKITVASLSADISLVQQSRIFKFLAL